MNVPEQREAVVVDLDSKRRGRDDRPSVTQRQIADRALWLARRAGRWSVRKVIRLPRGILYEIRYTWRGFTIVFAVWKSWVTVAHRTALLDEEAAFARKNGLAFNTRQRRQRDQDVKRNSLVTLIVVAAFVVGVGVLTFLYGKYVVWGVLLSTILLFDGIGHVKEPEPVNPERPITPLEPGVSIRKLQESIKDILWMAKPPVRLTFHGQRWLPHGVELDVHTAERITDDHLTRLERHLQAGEGMITLVNDKKNAAAPTLRLFWIDPLLGKVTPPRREPFSLTCTEPFELTRMDDGTRGRILFLGNHVFVVGRSGSGKSSGLWTIIDHLVDCRDAEVDGIDLTNGPVFGAYRRVMRRVAYSSSDAHVILDEAIDLALERNARLNAGMDADEDGLADENFVVGDAASDRARFIVIDEYSTLAQDDDLRAKAHRLLEIGRKARVHAILSSPSPDKRSNKSTAPVVQTMVKIVFGIPFAQITNVLGPGSVDEGWRPDRFMPSSIDSPHDSGKAYVQSGDHGRPVVQRFDRLEPEEIRERNRVRRQALRDRIVLPPAVKLLRDAFTRAGDPPQLATADVLADESARGWSAERLADALRPDLAPKLVRLDGGDRVARGYQLSDLMTYIESLRP